MLMLKYFVFILLAFQRPLLLQAQGFLQFHTGESAEGVSVREIPGGYDITALQVALNGWAHVTTDIDGVQNGPFQHTPTYLDGFTLHPLQNGDFLACMPTEGSDSLIIQRRSAAGDVLWEIQKSFEGTVSAINYPFVQESREGDLYLHARVISNTSPAADGMVFKWTATGQFVWSDWVDLSFTPHPYPIVFRVEPADNGECLILAADNNDTDWTTDDDISYMTRKSATGQTLANFPVPLFYYSQWNSTGILKDGRIYQFIADGFNGSPSGGDYTNVRLVTYDNAGAILTEMNITEQFQALMNNDPTFAINYPIFLADGSFVLQLAVRQAPNYVLIKRVFVKMTLDGEVLWLREIPQMADRNTNTRWGTEFPDGSIGYVGDWSNWLDPEDPYMRLFFLKFGANGEIYANTLRGTAARDENDNCLVDTLEQTLPGWILNIEQDAADWSTVTDQEGKYTFQADTGVYNLSLTAPGYLWDVCDNPQTVHIATDTVNGDYTTDFSVTALADCPFMQVDIVAPFLRAGIDNTYYVKYCNHGTTDATDVVVSIEADPLLEFVSASIPHQINEEFIEFYLGDVAVNECQQFSLVFATPDDPELFGQVICVTAHIRPDSICLPGFPGWSGALLEARGVCDGDSVRFEVKNIGQGISTPNLEYIIADDHVIMYEGHLEAIAPNDLMAFAVPANGASWRFSTDQEPNVPVGAMPSVQVEGCAVAGSLVSQGFAVQVANESGSPFSDTECRPLLSDGEPPTLSADPVGIPPLNAIPVTTEIEYLIQFHYEEFVNRVTIIDTLPAALNLATFSPGPSSLPYTWNFGSDGALYIYVDNGGFYFRDGFVQFAIKPKLSTPNGTLITNQATLHYGLIASEQTNEVFHTIFKDSTVSVTHHPLVTTLPGLTISPNPASEMSTVQLPFTPEAGMTLLVRNVLGQVMREDAVTGSQIRLNRNNLPAGLYWLECRNKGSILATGKLLWD